MKTTDHKIISLAAVLLGAFLLYCLPWLFSTELVSPDDMIYDFFSGHLAQDGRIGYRPPGDETWGREGFVPRYFVYSSAPGREGLSYPRKFPGFVLAWGALRALVPGAGALLFNPLCGALAIWLIYLVARSFHPDGPVPLLAAILAAVNPVLIHRTYMYNPTVFNLVLVLAVLVLLGRTLRRRSPWPFAALGLSLIHI